METFIISFEDLTVNPSVLRTAERRALDEKGAIDKFEKECEKAGKKVKVNWACTKNLMSS